MLKKLTKSNSRQKREFQERTAGLPCTLSCTLNCNEQSMPNYTIYLSGRDYYDF